MHALGELCCVCDFPHSPPRMKPRPDSVFLFLEGAAGGRAAFLEMEAPRAGLSARQAPPRPASREG